MPYDYEAIKKVQDTIQALCDLVPVMDSDDVASLLLRLHDNLQMEVSTRSLHPMQEETLNAALGALRQAAAFARLSEYHRMRGE